MSAASSLLILNTSEAQELTETSDPLSAIRVLQGLGATSVALILGLMSMGSPATDQVASTPLMWARVGFQAFTILLLIVAVLLQT